MKEHSYQERHMGTNVSLSFVCEEVAMANAIATDTFDTIHKHELCFSRFLPDSELSRLNKQGTLTVSDDFIAVLKKSIELYKITKRAFNPLLQVRTLGYTETFSNLKKSSPLLSSTTYNTELEKVLIDYNTNVVTLYQNQQLDFGGVLKGFLATKLADEISESHPACAGLIINIGGDLATRGFTEIHEPFIFALYNPITGEEVQTSITNAALATSGTYARSWQTNSGQRHHIVDFVSLQNPANEIVATSIIHKDGATAEALAKLFLVVGVSEALVRVPPDKNDYKYFAVYSDGNISTNLV